LQIRSNCCVPYQQVVQHVSQRTVRENLRQSTSGGGIVLEA
jgi:hypothetical protein